MPSAVLDNMSFTTSEHSQPRRAKARESNRRRYESPVISSTSYSEPEDDEEEEEVENEGEDNYSSSSSSGRSLESREAATNRASYTLPQSRGNPPSDAKRVPEFPTKTTYMAPSLNQQQMNQSAKFQYHLGLLTQGTASQESHEIKTAPIFTAPVEKYFRETDLFSQYGFIAGRSDVLTNNATSIVTGNSITDPRLFFNISAPSSAFICGSQGSGKSHTLSCLLENCLMKSRVSELENPLAGLLFHYDSFTSDERGTPCEAAYLSSNPNIKVRVLCSPTNLRTIQVCRAFLSQGWPRM